MLQVATNLMGLNINRNLKVTETKSAKASEKLSSGQRINRAADDAAGLAISEKMRAQIKGLNKAQSNVENGVSLIQTAEGGMQEISEMVKRQRELVVQAMNDTNTPEDRIKIQIEINQLTYEIDETARKTKYNGLQLLDVPGFGGRSEIDYGREVIRKSWETVVSVPNGTNAQIESLYNDFTALSASSSLSSLQDIATRLSDAVTKGNTAFVDIITTVNDIVAKLGDNAFDPNLLAIYRTEVDFHYNDKVHYEGHYLNPATQGTAEALVAADSATAYASLEKAFTGTPGGGDGAWGGGNGMVACHAPVSDAAWALLEDARSKTSARSELYIQAGANEEQGVLIDRYDCRAKSLGIDPIVVSPWAAAEDSLMRLDGSVDLLTSYRANAGAQQNRLEHTRANLGVASENLSAADSRIADTDMAREMMDYTKANILSQAGTSMLAQARQLPENVLKLVQ